VDLSSAMLDVARRLAALEGLTNVEFVQADAQIHPFGPASFDRIISRTGAMFFGDRAAAFASLAAAARPGGRLTLLTWQGVEHNAWIRSFLGALAAGRDLAPPPPDAPGPFALSEPAAVRTVLVDAGFAEPELEGLAEPMRFGADADEAFGFVLGQLAWMLDGVDDACRACALDALLASLAAHEASDGVWYESATWLITAVKP
jgi:ubiquinone/menaquinone biosynthesis C-methylase UbiE